MKSSRNEYRPIKGIDTKLITTQPYEINMVEMSIARLRALTHNTFPPGILYILEVEMSIARLRAFGIK